MTTVQCPSCAAKLRVNEERLGLRSSARCPRCQAQVDLTPATPGAARAGVQAGPETQSAATITVSCGSCGARLKAPASREGSTSTCPKCRAQVQIQAAAPPAATGSAVMTASSGGDQEESSSAATRRIDSRMLGMFGAETQASAGGVDLDEFVRTPSAAAPGPATSIGRPREEPEHGFAETLLKPPVQKLGKIAEEIRQTAEKLTESPGGMSTGSTSSTMKPSRPKLTSPAISSVHGPHPDPDEREARFETKGSPGASSRRVQSSVPWGRGLLSGGIAGLLVGAAAAVAATFAGAASMLAPLPVSGETLRISERALRVALPGILGALSGFLAAAGTASGRRGALTMLRCGGSGLLMGTACGLLGGLTSGTGLQIWPIAHWMRDLLLVGLLTPAINRIVPSSGR